MSPPPAPPPQRAIPDPASVPDAPIKPPVDLAGSEAFSDLDGISRDSDSPPPQPAQAKPSGAKPRSPDGTFAKPQKPSDKPDAAKPPVDKPPEIDFSKPPEKAGELRKHYDALKAKYDADVKSWETQKKEFEAKAAPKEWPEEKTYKEKLSAHEKRLQEQETQLQFTNFVKSQLYKDTYEKPYVEAWQAGQQRASQLRVVERKDEESAQVLQQARQGTKDDFNNLMSITDDDLAAEKAAELFGPNKVSMVMFHRERVQELERKANGAIKEYETKGAEFEKNRREQMEKSTKEFTGAVDNFMKAAVDRYPQLFKPDDADPKGNTLLDKGKHLLERVLQGGAPLADGEQQMTNDEYAIAIAAVRNKAIGFDRLAHRNRTLVAENESLKAKLKEFESTVPGNGDGGKRVETPAGGDEDDPFKALESMAKERPSF